MTSDTQSMGTEKTGTDRGAPTAGVFYDPLSYASYDHPYDIYAQLREQAPVYYNARRDLWVLSRYAEVKECLADSEHFVNALGNDMDGTHDSYGPGNLIALDGPDHSVIRDVVQPSFAGRDILALEPRIRELTRDTLAGLRSRGTGDIAAELALPLVFDTGLRFLGAPADESVFWQDHLLRSMARTVGQFGLSEDAALSNREAEGHIHEVMASRRAEISAGDAAGNDVITKILLAGANGVLDEAEQAGLAHLILSASTDAPAALITNCVALLDKFPALQQYLRANPGRSKAFVEETLRFDTPGTNLCRQTTSAVTIGGVTIPADSRVMVLLGSANRDALVYEHPDRFDITRTITPANRILSFGEGVHACMGAPLARLVAQVVVEELVALLDEVEIRVIGTPERWAKQMVRGFSSLPIGFVPAGKVERTFAPHASTAHLESVKHLSTRVTLTTRELETDVRVEAKQVVSDGVVALTLGALDGKPLPRWEPGSHVDLIIKGVATRQYSLSGDPADTRTWRLGILRDASGSGGSLYVHDELAVGDEVRVRGPRNNFPLVDSPRYLYIAGGIGITPILPMIRAADSEGADWRLVYGGRTRASMAFLEELATYGDRVSISPQDEVGLLDLDSLLLTPIEDTKVFCCGPEPLLNAVEDRCTTWPKGSLHVERFVAKPLTEPVLKVPFEVYLERSGITLTVPPDQSILAAVEQAGVGVRSSCEEGTCGSCETPVLEGVPDHRDSVLNAEEREAGNCMLICVSRSCSSRLVLDL